MSSSLSTTIGRWLYALPLAGFGLMHLLLGSDLNGYVPDLLPGEVFWVYVTGAGFLAACVSFLLGKRVRLAASLLALMFFAFVLGFDLPRLLAVDGRDALLGTLTNLFIDLAFAGSALILAGLYAPGDLSARRTTTRREGSEGDDTHG